MQAPVTAHRSGKGIVPDDSAFAFNPDFVAPGRSFGVAAERVDTPAALRQAIERADQAPAPIEVPVPTGSEVTPWTLLHPAPHG